MTLPALTTAQQRLAEATTDRVAALAARDHAVRAAVAGGATHETVAQALGVSRARVTQIIATKGTP